jgi:hypothetical protein
VEAATGVQRFKYSIAVTRLNGKLSKRDAELAWSSDPTMNRNLAGSTFSFLTMREMWTQLQQELTTTPASSEIGRLAQLLKAARVEC